MADPHDPDRYGETWPQHRIEACLAELEHLRRFVTLSGGWAWHFMSPPGHVELKHAHDHKDIDLFVAPRLVSTVIAVLMGRGFEKVWTRYDRLPSEEEFRRYEKVVEVDERKPFRVTIDFFVRDVPRREIGGWYVVEPRFLLTLYSNVHSRHNCFAVRAAVKLLAEGIDPVGREELVAIREE